MIFEFMIGSQYASRYNNAPILQLNGRFSFICLPSALARPIGCVAMVLIVTGTPKCFVTSTKQQQGTNTNQCSVCPTKSRLGAPLWR
jgi:hypothetical protein